MAARTLNGRQDQPFLKGFQSPKKTFRDIRNYLAGQFVGATRDDALLDEVVKCLYCKLYLETRAVDCPGQLPDDIFSTAQFYRSVFARVRSDFPEIYDSTDEILLDPKALHRVMAALDFSVLDAESDPIGDAYEVFAGSESRARSGQFFTPRNAIDFLVTAVRPQPGEKIIDPACGAGGFLASVARYFRKAGLSSEQIREASGNFFGVEKDNYLANLARIHVSLLTGGHPRIACADSLSLKMDDGTTISENIPISDYDIVLTNPPFGINIVAASPEILQTFELARKWVHDKDANRWQPTSETRLQVPPQVLFVERCLSLLRDGGRLGLVLPESVLSNKSYRYVMEFLQKQSTVQAVIGMPEALFKTSGKGGTHTKTCLVLLTKARPTKNKRGKIFMAEARWCGHDSRAREIPYDDLPAIADQFSLHKRGKSIPTSSLGFVLDATRITDNVLCPRYYDPELDAELQVLGKTHKLLRLGDLIEARHITLTTGDEVGKLMYGTGEIPFVRTSDLSNWEIKVDPKHCVQRELYLSLKDKQDVQPHDILMVKDGTYLIGTCALVSEYDREILFQSHIYKMRVHNNPYGINPFLLLAVLSSSVVQKQVRAKQFTQDIIDSLGERVRELLVPIPKNKAHGERITKMVQEVIDDRIRARELARRARVEVLMANGKP